MAYQITSDCTGCSYCAQWCPSGAITGRRKVRYTIESSKMSRVRRLRENLYIQGGARTLGQAGNPYAPV